MSTALTRASYRVITSTNCGLIRSVGVLREKKTSQCIGTLLSRYYASKSFPPHTVIKMPALSPTMTSGNIGAWQKQPGDTLSAGDVLVEIETDKAQMDFEFQDDGVMAKILKDSGEKDVSVGSPIAVYVEEGEDISAFADFSAADAGGDAKAAPPPQEEKSESSEPQDNNAELTSDRKTPEQPPEMQGKLQTVLAREDGRIIASPLAKAIALDRGISLRDVKGTGEGGRITKSDVEKHQSTARSGFSAATVAASSTEIPLSAMRKTIANRLTESKNTIPHYYVQSSLSVGKLLKLRQALNATSEGEYKLSINDFFIKAVSLALLKVPTVNSSYAESEGVIKQFNTADISVAVATPIGLMTPIVQGAHAKGLATISKDIKTLAAKARDGKLKPEEYQGGTFTISNMGMNPAIERFTAIVNPPQAGILAIGAVKKVPVQGQDGGIEWDEQIVVSGSFDHRVADGAVGAEFIKQLKKIIENPLELML